MDGNSFLVIGLIVNATCWFGILLIMFHVDKIVFHTLCVGVLHHIKIISKLPVYMWTSLCACGA